ncbi:MAG: hypothetical protein RLZZ453_1306 [Chlamydiota bacterium]|jgi:CBS domain containing-hemolysin-like protein
MNHPSLFFFLMILFCLIVQGFFAMIEMAAVSFNKVRLQYYVSSSDRRALWLNYLLHRPALLFGTTLIGVNTALIVGSECARRFYDSMGLSPDWAPLSQVILVLIFAEVAPLFAGRRYAEHVAMLGIPLLFFFSFLFRPIIWILDLACQGLTYLIGKPVASGAYLSREELQSMIDHDENSGLNTVIGSIFTLKNQSVKELMTPLSQVKILPSFCSVAELRHTLRSYKASVFPIYHRQPDHIIGVVYLRDLLRLSDNKKVKEYARPPWFITESTPIFQLVKQFRKNNHSMAVVLNEKGIATGILTLDEIVDEIFGKFQVGSGVASVILDRSFPSETPLAEINRQFQIDLQYADATTLEEVMVKILGHTPTRGESVRLGQFELIVDEASLLGPISIQVRTL